jgi:uncharacterized protein YycO
MRIAKYTDIRHLIKTGDRIEFAEHTALGRIIRFFTKRLVNHTAMALSIDQFSNYVGNRKFVIEAEPDGVNVNPLSLAMQRATGKVFWTPLKPTHDNQRDAAGDFALQQAGKAYDLGSLFKNAWMRVSADARKMFCSELYFLALKAGGLVSGANAPRPGEFDQFPIFGETIEITK